MRIFMGALFGAPLAATFSHLLDASIPEGIALGAGFTWLAIGAGSWLE